MRPRESGEPFGYVKKPTKGGVVVDEDELALELDDEEEEDMGALLLILELSRGRVDGIPE